MFPFCVLFVVCCSLLGVVDCAPSFACGLLFVVCLLVVYVRCITYLVLCTLQVARCALYLAFYFYYCLLCVCRLCMSLVV